MKWLLENKIRALEREIYASSGHVHPQDLALRDVWRADVSRIDDELRHNFVPTETVPCMTDMWDLTAQQSSPAAASIGAETNVSPAHATSPSDSTQPMDAWPAGDGMSPPRAVSDFLSSAQADTPMLPVEALALKERFESFLHRRQLASPDDPDRTESFDGSPIIRTHWGALSPSS